MKLQRLPESGFLYKGISVKYFSVRSRNILRTKFDLLTQSYMASLSETKRIILAIERLQVHEERKNILDSVQKSLDEKTLNKKNKRRL